MAFKFSLAALMRFRQGRERQQEILLREAAQQVATLRQEVEAIEQAIVETSAQGARKLQAGVSSAELQFDLLRGSVLLARGKQLEKPLAEAEALRERRREEFQFARQQREAVETLKGNQFQLYIQQEKRQEQRHLDDLFLLR